MSDVSMSSQEPRPAVLVVDDDPMLLTLLRTVLERRGFEVLAASSGPQGVELYKRRHDSTAVALLDVCMPGQDGPQTLAQLRQVDPDLRVCFMSGNTGVYEPDDLRAFGALRFFPKPFAIHDLAEELWQLAREAALHPV
jgi:CheY-like chemotaxis protein